MVSVPTLMEMTAGICAFCNIIQSCNDVSYVCIASTSDDTNRMERRIGRGTNRAAGRKAGCRCTVPVAVLCVGGAIKGPLIGDDA